MAFPVDVDAVAADRREARAPTSTPTSPPTASRPTDRSVEFEADLRFKRQKWELTIPLAGGRVADAALDQLARATSAPSTRARYGRARSWLGAAVELVGAARRSASAARSKPDCSTARAPPPTHRDAGAPHARRSRLVHLERAAGTDAVDVYARRRPVSPASSSPVPRSSTASTPPCGCPTARTRRSVDRRTARLHRWRSTDDLHERSLPTSTRSRSRCCAPGSRRSASEAAGDDRTHGDQPGRDRVEGLLGHRCSTPTATSSPAAAASSTTSARR